MNFARRRQASTLSGPKIALGISGGLLLILTGIAYWRWNVEGNPIAQSVVAPTHEPAVANSIAAPGVEPESSTHAARADAVVEGGSLVRASSTQPSATAELSTSIEVKQPAAQPPSDVAAPPRDKSSNQPPAARVAAVNDSAVDMEREFAFEGALQQARTALVSRNVTAANRALDAAEKNLPAESRHGEVATLRTQ